MKWFNNSTSETKRSTITCETIYFLNTSITNYKQLAIVINVYRMKLSFDKINYYKNNIFSYGNNSKELYSITRKLL